MNDEAVRALLGDWRDGAPLPGGYRLSDVGPGPDGAGLRFVLNPPGLPVELVPRSGGKAMARTHHFDVRVKGDPASSLPPGGREALEGLVSALKARDVAGLDVSPGGGLHAAAAADLDGGAALHLVPGHLGHPLDLGLRSVEALRRSAVWVIERGNAVAVRAAVAPFGLDAATLVEVSWGQEEGAIDPVLAALDAGQEVALFGGDEGIPGFCDPGAGLVGAVRAVRPDVPIRTLGGPSVLGAALMRADVDLQAFTFLGVTEHDDPAEVAHKVRFVARNVRLVADEVHHVVVFTLGAELKAIARALAEDHPSLETDLAACCDLGRPTEAYHRGVVRQGEAGLFDGVGDAAKVVLFARATYRRDTVRGWVGAAGGWVRRTVAGRNGG